MVFKKVKVVLVSAIIFVDSEPDIIKSLWDDKSDKFVIENGCQDEKSFFFVDEDRNLEKSILVVWFKEYFVNFFIEFRVIEKCEKNEQSKVKNYLLDLKVDQSTVKSVEWSELFL